MAKQGVVLSTSTVSQPLGTVLNDAQYAEASARMIAAAQPRAGGRLRLGAHVSTGVCRGYIAQLQNLPLDSGSLFSA